MTPGAPATTWLDFRNTALAVFGAALPYAQRAANGGLTSVTWSDGGRPFAQDGRVLLSIVSTNYDVDLDSALDTGGDQTVDGTVQATIQVTVESVHDGGAWDTLEQLRLGLRRQSVEDLLFTAAGQVSIVGYPGSARTVSYPADGRIVHAATFDVTFGFTLALDTSGPNAETLYQIEHVSIQATPDSDDALVDLGILTVDDPTPDGSGGPDT